MMRVWDHEPVAVEADPLSSAPINLHWQEQTHTITRIIYRWKLRRVWETRTLQFDSYKVLTDTGYVLTLRHDLAADCWYLTHASD